MWRARIFQAQIGFSLACFNACASAVHSGGYLKPLREWKAWKSKEDVMISSPQLEGGDMLQ